MFDPRSFSTPQLQIPDLCLRLPRQSLAVRPQNPTETAEILSLKGGRREKRTSRRRHHSALEQCEPLPSESLRVVCPICATCMGSHHMFWPSVRVSFQELVVDREMQRLSAASPAQ